MHGQLRLRLPGPDDEAACRAAQRELAAENFPFAFRLEPDTPWDDFLARLADQRAGRGLTGGWVPNTWLVAEVDGVIVGRSSLRHRLNDALRRDGGHIGYAVRPGHRRRGYATAILRRSLPLLRGIGPDSPAWAMLTCDDDNVGSRRVIESCGGVLDRVAPPPHPGAPDLRHYRIDLTDISPEPPPTHRT